MPKKKSTALKLHQASHACYRSDSLARALEMSRATAAAEAEEAEAFKLAVEASLMDAKEKVLGLGLKMHCHQAEDFRLASEATSTLLSRCSAEHPTNSTEPTPAPPESCVCADEQFAASSGSVKAFSNRVLKVSLGHDTRRLRSKWASDAPAQEVLACIQASIEDGFGLSKGSAVPPKYFLKYPDDEGDHCTLVEDTFKDFLETMALQGTSLRIIVQEQPQDQILQGMKDFSIATPPMTPRADLADTCSQTTEDEYEAMWSIVGVEP